MSGALLAKTEGIHGQSSSLCPEKSLELQEELFSLFGSTENGYSIARSLITYIRHRHKVCFSFDSCALRSTFVLWFLYTLLWFRNCYCALYALVIFFNLMSDNGAVCTHLFKPLWYIYIFLIQGDDWNSGVTAVSRNAAFMILLLVLNKPGCREALERGGTC